MKEVQSSKQEILPTPKVVGKMVLDNLSVEELFRMVAHDMLVFERRNTFITIPDSYRRRIIKTKPKNPVWYSQIIKGVSGLEYLILCGTPSYSDFKKNGVSYSIVGLYKSNGLMSAIMPYNNGFFGYYPHHFFERYKERKLGDLNIPTRDAIVQYFSNTTLNMPAKQDNPSYPNGVFSANEEGVCLGTIEEIDGKKHLIMKTFITVEMLRGGQVSLNADLQEKILKVYESNYEMMQARQFSPAESYKA